MTVTYDGSFQKLIFRWRGSLWRCIYKELTIYLLLYLTISVIYRFSLSEGQMGHFNNVIVAFDKFVTMIPLTFLLGFYVSSMITRYWSQFQTLAWPDDLCHYLNVIFPHADELSRLTRRTMVRYLVLSCVLAWRDVSVRVRKRFPTLDHVQSSGLMNEDERKIYEKISVRNTLWMVPLEWYQRIVEEQLITGKLPAPLSGHIFNHLNAFRAKFRSLFSYNWLSVPLTYTQVAAVATYAYFLFCLIGRQSIHPRFKVPGHAIDFYFPIFTTLQFVFYVGWLKVGQYIMHPFGEDDDDFELNIIIDRHLKVGLAIVDGEHKERPPITEDLFMSMPEARLPHTKGSIGLHEKLPKVKTGRSIINADTIIIPPDQVPLIKESISSSFASALYGGRRKKEVHKAKVTQNLRIYANQKSEPNTNKMVRNMAGKLERKLGPDPDNLSVRSLGV